MGYDPNGTWDWGVAIGAILIIAGAAMTVATLGAGAPIGYTLAGAGLATSVSFSLGTFFGLGYDYYFKPHKLFAW